MQLMEIELIEIGIKRLRYKLRVLFRILNVQNGV